MSQRPILMLAAAALLLCAVPRAGAIDLPVLAGGHYNLPMTSLKQIRFRSTMRQQYDFSCGSAALATLLTHHYGRPVTEQYVFERMYRQGDQKKIRREGFSLLDMQRFLATLGFKADGFKLPLQKLIDAKIPAIVLISDKGYHHFVVVKGVEQGRILIGDPSSGTRSLTRAAFEALWPSRLLFVIHDYPGAVQFNGLADWRAAPVAPLAEGVRRDGLDGLALPKLGPGDF